MTSKWTRRVTSPELATLLVMSFRYALGRQSTAPSTVFDLIRSYGHALDKWQREQVIRDIDRAIESGCAGMDCDVATWREVKDWLEHIPDTGKAKP